MVKEQPTPDDARAYVRRGIFERGGFWEGIQGLRHKTLPYLFGLESSLTVNRVLALVLRLMLLVAIALFPIVVRKAVASPPESVSVSPSFQPLTAGFSTVLHSLGRLSSTDYALGAIALLLTVVPKILDVAGKRKPAVHHPPYLDFAAALRDMPPFATHPRREAEDALRLVLSALRDEMSQLIGDEAKVRVTDVTFLEFCDDAGSAMQVRLRTANHEEIGRPVASGKFVAYYVAREGRSFAEHDFLRKRNPFPAKRITVLGSPAVTYRSVLYMPVMCSERTMVAVEQGPPAPVVVDYCIGVICVHSAKPYRFWRWGDHNKTAGGFADVAFGRAMPYITLVKRLTEQTAHKVMLETT